MSLEKDNEKQITHKGFTRQDGDEIKILNEYIKKFEKTHHNLKQRIEQKLRPLTRDQLIQIPYLAYEQFFFFLKCEYSLKELQDTKLFNSLSALVQASPYFTTDSYVPNSVISKQQYLADIELHNDSYLNAIKDCTSKYQVILIINYKFPSNFVLKQDPKILKFPFAIGVGWYLQNGHDMLDKIIDFNQEFQKLNQVIKKNIRDFRVGTSRIRVERIAENIFNLCNKDYQYKLALSEFMGLDASIHWEKDDIDRAIRSKVCLKKDFTKLIDFVRQIDKTVKKQSPNIQDLYPLEAYNNHRKNDELQLKISKKYSEFLEGYIDEICKEISNDKINQPRIMRLVEEFVATYNINSFTIEGVNLFTAVVDRLKNITSDLFRSAEDSKMPSDSLKTMVMIVVMLEERGGCYMKLNKEMISKVLPHTNLVAMHKQIFAPTNKVVSPELMKKHEMTF